MDLFDSNTPCTNLYPFNILRAQFFSYLIGINKYWTSKAIIQAVAESSCFPSPVAAGYYIHNLIRPAIQA